MRVEAVPVVTTFVELDEVADVEPVNVSMVPVGSSDTAVELAESAVNPASWEGFDCF